MTKEPNQIQKIQAVISESPKAKNEVLEALGAIMSEIGPIAKERLVQFDRTSFHYRGIDDVLDTFHGLLAKHHLIVKPRLAENHASEHAVIEGSKQPYHCWLAYEFVFKSTIDGSEEVVGPVLGEGADNADKGANKAISNALKYAFFQTFCIATGELKDSEQDADKGDEPGLAPPVKPPAKPVAKPPAKPIDEADDKKHRMELYKCIVSLMGNDVEAQKDKLVELTTFVNKEGQTFIIDSFKDPKLRGVRLAIALEKAKKELLAAEQIPTEEVREPGQDDEQQQPQDSIPF